MKKSKEEGAVMPNTMYFPGAWSREVNGTWLASLGFNLDSLLQASLWENEQTGGSSEEVSSRPYEETLTHLWHQTINGWQGLLSWGDEAYLELRWSSFPNLEQPPRGRLEITLTLNCWGETEAKARTEVLARYQPLQSILLSHFPWTIFTPVASSQALALRLSPFTCQEVWALVRRRQHLCLSQPLPASPLVMGFVTNKLEPATPAVSSEAFVEHMYPWQPAWSDSLSRLASFLLFYPDPTQLIVRAKAHPLPQVEIQRLQRVIDQCQKLLVHGQESPEVTLMTQAQALQDFSWRRLADIQSLGQANVAFYLGARSALDPSLAQTVANSFLSPGGGDSPKTFLQGGGKWLPVEPSLLDKPLHFPDEAAFSLSEAAGGGRLPWPPCNDFPGIAVKRWRTAFADLPDCSDPEASDIFLGHNHHRGLVQKVQVSSTDRMRHMFVLGQTGVGKSTFLESLILQDLQAGRGLCLLDPHGELVESIIRQFPAERCDDLVLLDLTDSSHPFPLNLLTHNSSEEMARIIDDLYSTLDRLYDMRQTGGPIFEKYFRGMLMVFMAAAGEDFIPTLLEFPLLFTSSKFRHWCLNRCKDDHLEVFMEEVESAGRDADIDNLAPYITSKLNRFTYDNRLRRIFGAQGIVVDFVTAMDQGKVVLINLGKGVFGETVSSLVASQLVGRFQHAAMSRAKVPASQRRDFFLYVDEFHSVVDERFADLLAEARKYRLGLVLATQYTEQLRRGFVGRIDTMLSSILGNVGMIMSFRVGLEDASRLAGVYAPTFGAVDLLELPNWQGYMKLHAGGQNIPPFNLATVPSLREGNPNWAEELRSISRKRYCQSADEVDAQIANRWRQIRKRS
ncbi:MAG: type IV secretion system DNA-binding domain-containing protein [Desulfarculus sp.]|nr:type IV secretion system DNA-binding domain-containing protein [Desulfarculus sp.]